MNSRQIRPPAPNRPAWSRSKVLFADAAHGALIQPIQAHGGWMPNTDGPRAGWW
jgi:hypothetical protein